MTYRVITIAITLIPSVALSSKQCKSNSDCASDEECKESVSGKMRCYPKESKSDSGYKKCKWIRDKDKCGEYICWYAPVVYCPKSCCVAE